MDLLIRERNIALALFIFLTIVYITLFTVSFPNMSLSVIGTIVAFHFMLRSGSWLYKTQQKVNQQALHLQVNTMQQMANQAQSQMNPMQDAATQAMRQAANPIANQAQSQMNSMQQVANQLMMQTKQAKQLANMSPTNLINYAAHHV